MLHDFRRALRVVMPPAWAIKVFLVSVAITILAELALTAWIKWQLDIALTLRELPTWYSYLLPHSLVAYAIWRGTFHPAWNSKYREWLEQSPWEPKKPLPLGPAHLVWQDGLVIAFATFAWTLPEDRWLLPLAFLVPYCAMLTWANLRTAADLAVFASLATAIATLLVWGQSILMLLLMLISYVCAYSGLRQSLRTFPWNELPRWKMLTLDLTGKNRKITPLWPLVHDEQFGNLQPWLTWKSVACLSTFAGWTAFCMSTCYLQFAAPKDVRLFSSELPWILFLVSCGLAGGRLAYCLKHWPPISLWARLRTLRIVIPKYDRALVAPLLTLAIGHSLPKLLIGWSLPLPVIAFLCVTVLMTITLGLAPSLPNWHLTGQHRLPMNKPGPGWQQL